MGNLGIKTACVCALFALALLAGGNFWQDKPASEWNEKEVRTMLTHSPWAKEITVTGAGPGAAQNGSESGERRGGGRSGGLGSGGNASGGMDASGGLDPSDTSLGGGRARGGRGASGLEGANTPRVAPSLKFTVRWMSALPMKEAMQRANGGNKSTDTESAQPEYLIAVSGFPAQLVSAGAEELKTRLKQTTALRPKGRDPIAADKIDVVGNDRSIIVLFHFPQQPAITADDKQVEFVASLGRVELRAKFSLKEMMYNARLEL